MHIDDLTAQEIQTVLAAQVDDLSDEQALALRDFIERIGGIENATAAVEMLSRLEDAA